MTPHDLDLWPHDLEYLINSSTLHDELPCQVWWRSIKSLGRYQARKVFKHDPIWPWTLTLRPWIPNQFIYPSWWVTMSSLIKIHQLTMEISCPQRFHIWPPYDLDLWPHDLKYLISSFTLSSWVTMSSLIKIYQLTEILRPQSYKDAQTNRRTNKRTDKQTDKRTDGWTDGRMNGRTDRPKTMPLAITYGGQRHNDINEIIKHVFPDTISMHSGWRAIRIYWIQHPACF